MRGGILPEAKSRAVLSCQLATGAEIRVVLYVTRRSVSGLLEVSTLTAALEGGTYSAVAALFTSGELDAYKTTTPVNHDFVSISAPQRWQGRI